MARLIDPPTDQHDKLLTPLTNGEKKVIDLFDRYLPQEWEIYIQPHLNGLRPDIVLLHPKVGIAVFEIKDWDLNAMHYYTEQSSSGRYALWARDRNGKVFSLEEDNPVNKILLYKDEIFNLYCPRLNHKAGKAVITAGLIFPFSKRFEVDRVFTPFRDANDGMRIYPQYHPISGMEDVASGNLNAIFPESDRQSSKEMTPDLAEDLRGWLKEPFFSQEQRTKLKLDSRQIEITSTRTQTGYRRIKGPAGSGKSVVIAARASVLADERKNTLVVSFNITLLNYLRDLAVRHNASRSEVKRQIAFLNFHAWCKRVCYETGHWAEYKRVWDSSSDGVENQNEFVLNEGLASLVKRLYHNDSNQNLMPRYDAILVDEGQIFRPNWWETLRAALKKGGEMMLVADKTQNIYGTANAWTEGAMENAGFQGRWIELKTSYRLPPPIVPLVRRFAQEFMTAEEIDIPEIVNRDIQLYLSLWQVELLWVQVEKYSDGINACFSALRRMMKRLRKDSAFSDVTILTAKELGRNLVDLMESNDIHVLHTFAKDKDESRRQKRAFFQGAELIKATTLHSFIGWEARHLIVFVDSFERPEDRALIYTSLTRLLGHENGSALTVVSCCPELKAYGQSWPEFVQYEQGKFL